LSVYALAEDPNPQNPSCYKQSWQNSTNFVSLCVSRGSEPPKSSHEEEEEEQAFAGSGPLCPARKKFGCDEFQGKFKLKLCCQIESCLKPSLLNSGQQYTSSLLFKFMLRVDFRFSLELHGIDSIIMLTLMGTAVIKQLQQVGQ
jgi:hypothetical protein